MASSITEKTQKKGENFFDIVAKGDEAEAGFLIASEQGRFTYPWLRYDGSFGTKDSRMYCIKLGKEQVHMEYPEGFPITTFEEALRTQRLRRLVENPEKGLKICVVEPDPDGE